MKRFLFAGVFALLATACGTKIDPVQFRDLGPVDVPPDGITWCRDIQPLAARFCAGCHSSTRSGADRNGAPVGTDFDTYASTVSFAAAAGAMMQNGAMPPSGRIPDVDLALYVEWFKTGMKECSGSVSEEVPTDVPDVPPQEDVPVVLTCTSGTSWTPADGEGFQMRPGENCIACHAQHTAEGAPSFLAAGTVMGAFHDQDDCNGTLGVVVAITGSDKVIRTRTSNAAGNFWWETGSALINLPYTVSLSYDGRNRKMTTPQNDLNCASCHTEKGANGAPGRIVAP